MIIWGSLPCYCRHPGDRRVRNGVRVADADTVSADLCRICGGLPRTEFLILGWDLASIQRPSLQFFDGIRMGIRLGERIPILIPLFIYFFFWNKNGICARGANSHSYSIKFCVFGRIRMGFGLGERIPILILFFFVFDGIRMGWGLGERNPILISLNFMFLME